MSSRRSGRVAALQLAKPATSYKEVNSDDDMSGAQNSNSGARTTRGRKGAAATTTSGKQAQSKNGNKQKQAVAEEDVEDDNDDDVIVLDGGEADEQQQQQSVDGMEVGTPQQEEEDDAEEDSSTKRPKRKRAAATKQRKPATQKAEKKQKTADAKEAIEREDAIEEEEALQEEEEEQEAKPAKATKRKRASAAAKKGKSAKKAAAGGASDPIALDDDGEEEEDAKPKKPTKPKKEKQPKLLPHIRTVTTALPHSNKLLGAHVGTAGGVHFGPHNAALMGARCFAMDTRSKRRWASAPYSAAVIDSFHSHMAHYGYSGSVVLPHGSYLTNLGCLSDTLWLKSKACITEELERCQQLGVTRYVFHPGRASTSGEEREEEIKQEKEKKKLAREKAREKAKDRKKRLKAGEEVSDDEDDDADASNSQPAVDPSEYLFRPSTPAAVRSYITAQPAVRIRSLARLITALNELLSPAASAKYRDVHILIETMAAVGNQLCSRFEELRYVIDAVQQSLQQDAASSRIGVCLDTCHVFAADERYDMRQPDGYERVMKEVEDIIGWQYVKGMHMNDSKCALGSHRDRHENIGDGEIGIELFRCIMNDKRWDGVPMVLETPCRTEAKEAAKRKKKALAAGEAVEGEEGEDDEEGDEDDEEGEEGGKKGKGKGKAKDPKEKEDWVKSYSDEIDMIYGLEEGDRKPVSGVKGEEGAQVKEEKKESMEDGEDEEMKTVKEEAVAVVVTEINVEETFVAVKPEKQKKVVAKRSRRGKAKAAEAADEDGEDEDE